MYINKKVSAIVEGLHYSRVNEENNPNTLKSTTKVQNGKNFIDVASLNKKCGTFKFGGGSYVLLQDAYADNNKKQEAAYFAKAVKLGDKIVDGEVPLYEVEWEIINKDTEDSGDACKWDNPINVKKVDLIEVK